MPQNTDFAMNMMGTTPASHHTISVSLNRTVRDYDLLPAVYRWPGEGERLFNKTKYLR